jgi:queuosine precursor transporter
VLDTGIFAIAAFAGTLPNDVLWTLMLSNYLFKCGVEIGFTPLTYGLTGWLKRQEQEDYYDVLTDFNPLPWLRLR